MMKNILILASLFLLTSCLDISAVMLYGGPGKYNFTNASLDSIDHVDESKIHRLQTFSDQDTVEILYVGDYSQIESDTIILYLHGNVPSMDGYWTTVAHIANIGEQHRYGVMMYDYRGYGKSTGTSTDETSLASDYESVVSWLQDQGLDRDRLIVFANSIGSLTAGPAAAGGSLIPIEKLIMETPQSSSAIIMQNSTGLSLPSSMLTNFEFDLSVEMLNYPGELLWMHGVLDATAPFNDAASAMRSHEGSYFEEAIYPSAGHALRWEIGNEEWDRVLLNFILK